MDARVRPPRPLERLGSRERPAACQSRRSPRCCAAARGEARRGRTEGWGGGDEGRRGTQHACNAGIHTRSAHAAIMYQESLEPDEPCKDLQTLQSLTSLRGERTRDGTVLQVLCQRAQLLAQVAPQRLQLAYGAHVPARLVAGVYLGPSTDASRMQIQSRRLPRWLSGRWATHRARARPRSRCCCRTE